MAAALYSSRTETATTNYADLYARPFLLNNNLDMNESRYPSSPPLDSQQQVHPQAYPQPQQQLPASSPQQPMTKPPSPPQPVEAVQYQQQQQQQQRPELVSSSSRQSARSPRSPAELAVASSEQQQQPYDRTSPAATPLSSNIASFSPASANYAAPVSSRNRAYPQQPTYTRVPNPVNPVYGQGEEICVECSMRDQDMADVDVTTPGVWERESDVHFEDLKNREREEARTGVVNEDPTRPRSKGGRLSEQNLKLWLSINPREPASRQQTLNTYVKSQRTLIEAETLARARALQESKQLDNRMRDAYSQLRRSAYDMGNSAAPVDDVGGVRIKAPNTSPAHDRSTSREVTLLENGMIVEHVDVKKEEREARDRRRREEKRVRKLSKSSGFDVGSTPSLAPYADSGIGLRPYSQYSQTTGQRPTSVLTAPMERQENRGSQSQLSFSDVHSTRTASPRRSSFFPQSWASFRSNESLAPSGSMVDMHVALQREHQRDAFLAQQPGYAPPLLPSADLAPMQSRESTDKSKKKTKGLGKIWRFVTRSSKQQESQQPSRGTTVEDDTPLAPPPPLSYLVNRTSGDTGRHASTSSLSSAPSPKVASPSPSAPFSPTSPSLSSSKPSGSDGEYNPERNENEDDVVGNLTPRKNVHPVNSEPDFRRRMSQPILRDKVLPPLPSEARPFPASASETRPRTLYTMDSPSQMSHEFAPPNPAFRGGTDTRRQSFSGMLSRPATLFSSHTVGAPPRRDSQLGGANYNEFGGSRHSLGRPMSTTSKRKSKFNLSSLLGHGKKSYAHHVEPLDHFPNGSAVDLGDETTTGYATSNSRHSAFSAGPGPRMSIASRKVLEELVTQDSEFVAYRYPSNGQRLDLLR